MTVCHHRRGDKTPRCEAAYRQLHLPYTLQEDTNVLPPPCDRMEYRHPDPFAPLEQIASHRLGPLESGHGPGPLLCLAGCQCVLGDVAGPPRADRAPAIAGVLL